MRAYVQLDILTPVKTCVLLLLLLLLLQFVVIIIITVQIN